MPERSDIRLLCGDITEAVGRILQYTSDMTYGEFVADIRTQDAVVRSLEILGEAVKNLPESFKMQHPEVVAVHRRNAGQTYSSLLWRQS